jgi:putative ABC transport system substrate-binding protein
VPPKKISLIGQRTSACCGPSCGRHAARFAVLVNPNNPLGANPVTDDVRAAAVILAQQIEIRPAATNRDIDTVFAYLVEKRTDAVLFTPDTLFDNRRVQLATLAARYRLPALHWKREFAEVGGLLSYGSNVPDIVRQTGVYAGRILKGESPAELPILQATKFEFVINLQTARVIGVDVPPTLLARADEVIE